MILHSKLGPPLYVPRLLHRTRIWSIASDQIHITTWTNLRRPVTLTFHLGDSSLLNWLPLTNVFNLSLEKLQNSDQNVTFGNSSTKMCVTTVQFNRLELFFLFINMVIIINSKKGSFGIRDLREIAQLISHIKCWQMMWPPKEDCNT